jgi:rhodanese-related sulfurtransferase
MVAIKQGYVPVGGSTMIAVGFLHQAGIRIKVEYQLDGGMDGQAAQ